MATSPRPDDRADRDALVSCPDCAAPLAPEEAARRIVGGHCSACHVEPPRPAPDEVLFCAKTGRELSPEDFAEGRALRVRSRNFSMDYIRATRNAALQADKLVCDTCRAPIRAVDVREGRAIVVDKVLMCGRCAARFDDPAGNEAMREANAAVAAVTAKQSDGTSGPEPAAADSGRGAPAAEMAGLAKPRTPEPEPRRKAGRRVGDESGPHPAVPSSGAFRIAELVGSDTDPTEMLALAAKGGRDSARKPAVDTPDRRRSRIARRLDAGKGAGAGVAASGTDEPVRAPHARDLAASLDDRERSRASMKMGALVLTNLALVALVLILAFDRNSNAGGDREPSGDAPLEPAAAADAPAADIARLQRGLENAQLLLDRQQESIDGLSRRLDTLAEAAEARIPDPPDPEPATEPPAPVDPVLAGLSAAAAADRYEAALEAHRRRVPEAVPRLIEMARADPDEYVRVVAIQVLALLDPSQARPTLEFLVRSEHSQRIVDAARAALDRADGVTD
jgi:hypothetical protein